MMSTSDDVRSFQESQRDGSGDFANSGVVGFIGLGVMGRPMALNLLSAGFPLKVHSRSEGPVSDLVSKGALRGASPAEIGAACDVLITMLPDTSDVEEVVLGENGLLQGMNPGSLLVDMSTISPRATRRIAARCSDQGVGFVDAPVSGGQRGAIDATLTIMAGGNVNDFDRALPVLEAIGGNVTHVGSVGAGQVTKAANQLIVGSTILAVAEAMRLATKAGVDADKVRAALMGGFASSRVLDEHGGRMLRREFDPGFRSELHLKDARIVVETANSYGAVLAQFPSVVSQFERMSDQDMGRLDHAALYLAVESLESTGSGAEAQGNERHA